MRQRNLLYLIIITGLVWILFLISSGKLWAACVALPQQWRLSFKSSDNIGSRTVTSWTTA